MKSNWPSLVLTTVACLATTPAAAQNPLLATNPDLQLLIAGEVDAVLRLSDGSVVIGGKFSSVNGTTRKNIAKIKADGTLDAAWNPAANGQVRALARDAQDNIYVGGFFSDYGAAQISIGGQVRNYLAKLSPTGAGAADATWNPAPGSSVFALAYDGIDAVYVGGGFTSIGGQPIARLAKVSAATATVDANWKPAPGNSSISALVFDGGSVYAAGGFTTIGGQPFKGLAKLAATGTGLADAAWNPAPDQPVSALAADGLGNVYVGGYFNAIGGQTRTYLARLAAAGNGAADATWNPAPNSLVTALCADAANNAIFAGGYFTSIGGQSRKYLARLSGTGAGNADGAWDAPADNLVLALASGGGKVHAGGSFAHVAAQLRMGYAALASSGTATLATAADVGNPGSINALLRQNNGGIIAGGAFVKVNGQAHGNLLRLQSDGTLDNAWHPQVDVLVNALAQDATGNIFVGGVFSQVDGLPRKGLAKLSAGGSVDANWNPQLTATPFNGYALALATDAAGNVYVGGSFSQAGGLARSNLAKIPGSGNGAADPNWNPGPDNSVYALATDTNGNVFAGGSFSNIGGGAHHHLAKLSATGNGAADPTWSLYGTYIQALLVGNGWLYAGGSSYLKKIQIATGSIDAGWNPNPDSSVNALALDSAGNVYAGGDFDALGSIYRENIARILADGSVDPNWNAHVVDATTKALLVDGGSAVLAGGQFTTIAGGLRIALARLVGDAIFANGFE
ncbi:MAG: delta-60 repeat domain-containing protein [Proteobacteria bacterium]|nr:delta-60 repeat domain-containing protein [Pseudomonadota bacterium]